MVQVMETPYYDYFEVVKQDALNYIMKHKINIFIKGKEYADSVIYDELYDKDEVTGFGRGSYTLDAQKAEEYQKTNESDMYCIREDFGEEIHGRNLEEYIAQGPEACDTLSRLFSLPPAASEIAEELWEDDEYLKMIGIESE